MNILISKSEKQTKGIQFFKNTKTIKEVVEFCLKNDIFFKYDQNQFYIVISKYEPWIVLLEKEWIVIFKNKDEFNDQNVYVYTDNEINEKFLKIKTT